jgi:hypothetical protein
MTSIKRTAAELDSISLRQLRGAAADLESAVKYAGQALVEIGAAARSASEATFEVTRGTARIALGVAAGAGALGATSAGRTEVYVQWLGRSLVSMGRAIE